MNERTTTQDAWGFIEDHRSMIDRFIRRWSGALGDIEREDFTQNVLVRIADRYPTLRLNGARNPSSVISTWIGWQVRGVQAQTTRRFHKRVREGGEEDPEIMSAIPISIGAYGSPDIHDRAADMEAAFEAVSKLYGRATEPQRRAMTSVLEGLNGNDVRKKYRMTLKDRNSHLRDVSRYLED